MNNTIEILYFEPVLENKILSFKNRISKTGCKVSDNRKLLLEDSVCAGSPVIPPEFFQYAKYAAVFGVSAFFAGFIGKMGSDAYDGIKFKIFKFIKDIKDSKKGVVVSCDVPRDNNYPLRLFFVIENIFDDSLVIDSLGQIPTTIKNIYFTKGIIHPALEIHFKNNYWDLSTALPLKVNTGKSILNVARSKKYGGDVPAKYWPNQKKPGQNEYEYLHEEPPQEALDHVLYLTAYYRRMYTFEEMRRCLYFAPFSLSVEIFKNFFSTKNGQVELPDNLEQKITNHCVTVLGINDEKKTITFLNSWGTKWGERGCGSLPFEYVEKYMVEAGVCAMSDSLEDMGVSPKKLNFLKYIWHFVSANRIFRKKLKTKVVFRKGKFIDKSNTTYEYECSKVNPMINLHPFAVIDVMDKKIPGKKNGWVHLSIVGDCLFLEEIFVWSDYRNKNWGSIMLELVEIIARANKLKSIFGWVPLEDVQTSADDEFIHYFFQKNGYVVVDDEAKPKGCAYKIFKELGQNVN
ncbi:MAG: C1 family peptidase [Patescibacteria group bacterium]|nr:C1 family peptidase [Patescibacteria group bacterium]